MTCTSPKLRLVLILVVTLSILPVIAIISWFFTVQYKEAALIHLHHYAVTVAENVASAEADFIITENYASLQDSIMSFQRRVHVESITVTTPDGTVIADTDPENLGDSLAVPIGGAGRQPGRNNIQVDFKTGQAKTLLPIQVGNSTIGWCKIVLDIGYVQDGLVSMKNKITAVTGIALFIISVLIFFFSTAVTRPLEDMMVVAEKVADGDFDQHAKVAGVFEIRRLAEVFNLMTNAVKEREHRLHQAQKMEAIGILSSSIAHEFGNPLMGISFLLGDLKRNSCLDEEHQRLLDLGLEECSRMKKLIRDLKCFYRPTSGQVTPVVLHDLIDNILLFQKSFLKSRKIEVVKAYGTDIPPVMAVEDQIKQVLVNLLINAAESMDEAGGTVTIGTETDAKTVAITIHDTGAGISRENQEDVFMPFFSTKPEVSGTGLGLSVSYGIVKNHKGEIKVASSPEQGTTFTLVLPVA